MCARASVYLCVMDSLAGRGACVVAALPFTPSKSSYLQKKAVFTITVFSLCPARGRTGPRVDYHMMPSPLSHRLAQSTETLAGLLDRCHASCAAAEDTDTQASKAAAVVSHVHSFLVLLGEMQQQGPGAMGDSGGAPPGFPVAASAHRVVHLLLARELEALEAERAKAVAAQAGLVEALAGRERMERLLRQEAQRDEAELIQLRGELARHESALRDPLAGPLGGGTASAAEEDAQRRAMLADANQSVALLTRRGGVDGVPLDGGPYPQPPPPPPPPPHAATDSGGIGGHASGFGGHGHDGMGMGGGHGHDGMGMGMGGHGRYGGMGMGTGGHGGYGGNDALGASMMSAREALAREARLARDKDAERAAALQVCNRHGTPPWSPPMEPPRGAPPY